jgi:hypothetical protein
VRSPLLVVVVLLPACTTIRPATPVAPLPSTGTFSHADFDRALARFVDEDGRVDYAALAADPADLDRYYAALGAASPDSHPALFPTRQAELAYWLNAYNAAVLETVLAHWPIESVRDVGPPPPLFFLPRLSGFFWFQRVRLGGRTTNLYDLEHRVVRARYRDPRVHFALNCASRGCPRLPRRAFDPERLDAQLDRETRRFLGEPRNVRVDAAARRVLLSSIFEWYESDFTDWTPREPDGRRPTLLGWIARHAPGETAAALAACAGCAPVFVPWDWRLNDRGPSGGAQRRTYVLFGFPSGRPGMSRAASASPSACATARQPSGCMCPTQSLKTAFVDTRACRSTHSSGAAPTATRRRSIRAGRSSSSRTPRSSSRPTGTGET